MVEDFSDSGPSQELDKLKKLIKEKEKEIKSTEKAIKKAEEQINIQNEWKEKVPIPQVAATSLEGLSEEEKLILKLHKNLEEKSEEEADEESSQEEKEESTLEETISEHEFARKQEQGQSLDLEFISSLSQQPMQELYQEMTSLYQGVKDKGYMSTIEQERVRNISSAIERKLEDVENGDYSFTTEVAHRASDIDKMKSSINVMYNPNKDDARNMNDWYQ